MNENYLEIYSFIHDVCRPTSYYIKLAEELMFKELEFCFSGEAECLLTAEHRMYKEIGINKYLYN